MTPPNPLIEGPTDTSATQGAKVVHGLTKAAQSYGAAFTDDDFGFMDVGSMGITTAVAAIDVMSFVANPFKHLIQAGLGWLFEHISFLREPLDWLAGNPQAIEGLALTWNNISTELHTAADEWVTELEGLQDWNGADAAAYREAAGGFEAVLRATSEAAMQTALGINTAGAAVGLLRTLFLEIITNFIAEAIMWVLSALATAGFTFGATAAAAIARVVSKAVNVFSKMVSKLGQLMSKFGRWILQFRKYGTQSTGLRKALDATTDKILKHSSYTAMESGSRTMNVAHRLRHASSTPLAKSWNPLKNSWKNPIDKVKLGKHAATEVNDVAQLEDDMIADQREARGLP